MPTLFTMMHTSILFNHAHILMVVALRRDIHLRVVLYMILAGLFLPCLFVVAAGVEDAAVAVGRVVAFAAPATSS